MKVWITEMPKHMIRSNSDKFMNRDKNLNKHSLEIPLYLNQKIMFDLLASVNDGLTQVTKLKTTSAREENLEGTIEADLGNKNIFALLGVKLKGKADAEHNREDNKEQEKIHTPSSLFNNLKDRLFKDKMVRKVTDNFKDIQAGEFVEVTGVLKINPLISTMENMVRLMELATAMNGDGTGRKAKQQNPENRTMINQVKAFTNGLKIDGMVDMICELDGFSDGKAVLPIYMNYFFNGNSGEVIDGKFKVLGKVAKVCGENEKIDLLRNTSLSLFKENILENLLKVFNNELNQNINIGEIETIIKGPALLIIPIAIYL